MRMKNKWIKQLRSPERWGHTEQIRMIRTNIYHMMDDRHPIVLITSPKENKWQPFFSAKLASSFAEAGKKVLLVDMDFRQPMLHQLLRLHLPAGLSNMLTGEEGTVYKGFIENLYILPAGSLSVCLEDMEEMEQWLLEWQDRYDLILLHAPSFLETADAQILAAACRNIILMIQENKTTKQDLLDVKKTLERINSTIVGAVYQTS
ncbi:CpsD/CapB family tyrosine-protein kinase [Bacillus badius]|nr:CpsD/CapB family tyrosine-protein kinase [Bacillus badius]MED4717596.1 CpsD/CapB family tyrosine-protein kinase [Bacillus badius]